ncbi:7151_t:CDS:1, partial [Dentiscutata heterogama]
VDNQKKEINNITESKRIHFPTFAIKNVLYKNIRGKVSTYALKKINEQYQRAKLVTSQEPLPPY